MRLSMSVLRLLRPCLPDAFGYLVTAIAAIETGGMAVRMAAITKADGIEAPLRATT